MHAALMECCNTQITRIAPSRFAMKEAGFTIAAEWLFGQDADDLMRAMLSALPAESRHAMQLKVARLGDAIGPLQASLDKARLSDARHILAVKDERFALLRSLGAG